MSQIFWLESAWVELSWTQVILSQYWTSKRASKLAKLKPNQSICYTLVIGCKIIEYKTCLLQRFVMKLWCRPNLEIYCGSKPQALPNIRLGIHFTLGIECNDSLFVWYIVSFVDQAYQAIFHWNLPWNNLFYKHSKNILSQLNSTWVTKPDLSQFLTQLTQVSRLIPSTLVAMLE